MLIDNVPRWVGYPNNALVVLTVPSTAISTDSKNTTHESLQPLIANEEETKVNIEVIGKGICKLINKHCKAPKRWQHVASTVDDPLGRPSTVRFRITDHGCRYRAGHVQWWGTLITT